MEEIKTNGFEELSSEVMEDVNGGLVFTTVGLAVGAAVGKKIAVKYGVKKGATIVAGMAGGATGGATLDAGAVAIGVHYATR